MKKRIIVGSIAVALIGLICSCNHPQQIDIQEQIKTDYDHIQTQISEIESELLNDTMDMESPQYKELIRMDDSLQTAIFTMYDYEDLKTFFENNVKDGMNKYQYQNLMLELEEYREK